MPRRPGGRLAHRDCQYKYPQVVRFVIVVAVSSAREVHPSAQVDALPDGLNASITWRHSSDPTHFLTQGRRIALEQYYQSETFILLAYACIPVLNWDALAVRLMTDRQQEKRQRSTHPVLTAIPGSRDDDARFPRLSIPSQGTGLLRHLLTTIWTPRTRSRSHVGGL